MPPIDLTAGQARLLRLRSQRLHPAQTSLPGLFADILAVQAQDLPAALLAIRARCPDFTAPHLERALQQECKLAWTWTLRGTLHLTSAGDARWLVPFLGPDLIAGDQRRMRQLGWDENQAEAAVRLVETALARQGRLTRAEIARLLETNGFSYQGQAPVHLIFRAALQGILCAVPEQGSPAYVPSNRQVGKPQPLPREEALAMLAQRYLQAYAPASVEDLAAWSGLKPHDARLAWELNRGRIEPVAIQGKPAGLLKTQLPWLEQQPPPEPVVRLLPRFDASLLGYASRGLAVDPAYSRRINAGGGMISAVLLVDGQVLGTWKTACRKKSLQVVVTPFEHLPDDLIPFIEAEAAAVGRFLDQETVLTFQGPDSVSAVADG